MRLLLFLITIPLLVSGCSANRIEPLSPENGTNRSVIQSGRYPGRILLYSLRDASHIQAEAGLVQEWTAAVMDYFSLSGTNLPALVTLPARNDLYSLYFSLGIALTHSVQNDVFRYGLLQSVWMKWLERRSGALGRKFPELSAEKSDPYRLPEIGSLLGEYQFSTVQRSDLTAWNNSFLLREILFVSVQEFLTRPWRYYQFRELESPFYRVVVMPETLEFCRFLEKRFGRNILLKFASEPYSKENWKKVFDEEVNESEEKFTKTMENRNYDPVFHDTGFSNRLTGLLRFYNTSTKTTLFKK